MDGSDIWMLGSYYNQEDESWKWMVEGRLVDDTVGFHSIC
jgi:hypothetical protein